jgi:hypothetical protein
MLAHGVVMLRGRYGLINTKNLTMSSSMEYAKKNSMAGEAYKFEINKNKRVLFYNMFSSDSGHAVE